MNENQIYGVLRHLLSALGGFAVYKGVLTEDEASSVIAASIVTGKHCRDRKSTRLNSSHSAKSRMPSSA